MENGIQALKIASGMLIFVLAITITISSFTSVAQVLNRIFDMQDADQYVTDEDGNFLNFMNFEEGVGTRVVGVETIIPAIYRAYKENYAIYFYNADGTEFVLYETEKGGEKVQVNYIELEKEVYANAEAAIQSVNELLEKGLYERLERETFTEMLGEFYMDDISGESETAEVNKTKKRVIAYIVNR